MATKHYRMELSKSGINKTIEMLEKYKEHIQNRNEVFVRRLAEIGIPVVDEQIALSYGDSNKYHQTEVVVNRFQDHVEARLVVYGEDLLFMEFGAGVTYNGAAGASPHPKGEEFGYTIGSYGKGHGKDEYWYYTDETGVSHRSYGTQATFPVYLAGQEMIQNIRKIAREVFGSGN